MGKDWPGGAPFCVSLTYDVEQCTNFPYWTCVWDHEKGAIDNEARRYVEKLGGYALEAGVLFQWFALGKTFEDPDVAYLQDLSLGGHPIGNHTYRHVNVKAKQWDQVQVTYRLDPSLQRSHATPLDAIREEVLATTRAMEARLGVAPAGFRTPGGFTNGLEDVPEVQDLLKEAGFQYVSSHYKFPIELESYRGYPIRNRPTWEQLEEATRWSVTNLQPYRYGNGLLEIPMMGVSDIWAFRVLDLEREEWFRLMELGVDIAAETGSLFSILMHPQVLASRDPHAVTARRVVERTLARGGAIVTNDEI
ncbi:MAG: hypothetical protein FJX77_08030, partial [Armatimonadetes bacterium]|nr:hypothetical protein [Armatimonadota bacterium]